MDESTFKQSSLVMLYNINDITEEERRSVYPVFNYIIGSGGLSSKLYNYLRKATGIPLPPTSTNSSKRKHPAANRTNLSVDRTHPWNSWPLEGFVAHQQARNDFLIIALRLRKDGAFIAHIGASFSRQIIVALVFPACIRPLRHKNPAEQFCFWYLLKLSLSLICANASQ